MRMTDVRISVRLGACFAGLVILMGLIAAMGVRSLITATNGTREIVQQRYTKVMVVATLIEEVNNNARVLRNILLARNTEETETYLKSLREGLATSAEAIKKLEGMIEPGEEQALMQDFYKTRDTYRDGRNIMLDLIKQNRKTEAIDYLFVQASDQQRAFNAALEKLQQYQTSQMQRASDRNEATAHSAIQLMVVASGLAIVFSFLAAVSITRSITRPLNEAVKTASAVAAGDLTMDIDYFDKKI